MKSITFTILIIIPFVAIFAQEDYEPGVILLQVRQPEVVSIRGNQVINGSSELQAAFQQNGAIGSRKLSHVNAETDGWYRVEFPTQLPLEEIRTALLASPDIRYVTLNYYGRLSGIPNDPLWTNQWALQKIQMPQAWDITKGNSTILVGVMDMGYDYTHEDLADNIWSNPDDPAGNGDEDGNGYVDDVHGWDFFSDDNDPQDDPYIGHGTRVAGVIGARTYNSTGVAGIAGGWQNQDGVRLIGLRMAASPDFWAQQHAGEAINYLTNLRQNGHTVIANMSFQTIYTDDQLIFFKNTVSAAKDAGVIMVAAAGNVINDPPGNPYDHPDVQELPAPARWDGVLAIGASKYGATLQDEKRSSYSLYDAIDSRKLLVVAPVDKTPALNIVTTYPGNQYSYDFNGTSAACPIVVGVVALMLSVDPSLDYSVISNILASTAEKIGIGDYTYDSSGRTLEVGYGRVNAYSAVNSVPPPDPPPSPPQDLVISNAFQYGQLVKLSWTANTEPDLKNYNIYRMTQKPASPWTVIGTSTSASYRDREVRISDSGTSIGYYYYVTAVDLANNESLSSNSVSTWGEEGVVPKIPIGGPNLPRESNIPADFTLGQNYPNPFNPTAKIQYQLPEPGDVKLVVYDMLGRLIGVLFDQYQSAGYYEVAWDGRNIQGNEVTSGVYFYHLIVSRGTREVFTDIKKMVLMR